jgi:tRNA/rRNA methyltransferase
MNAPFEHISIVLIRPQHSGNIGAIARSIANHGLGQLILVDPPAFDPDRARWMAPHAHHIIDGAKFVKSVEDAVLDAHLVLGTSARNRAWNIPFIDIPTFCERAATPQRIALLFGPEDSGLSNIDMQFCHAMIALPTHHHQSLNLSQAVNVFGAHLMQSSTSPSEEISSKPTIGLQKRVVDAGMQTLEMTSFLNGKNPVHVRNHLIQVMGKANLPQNDLVFLKSICDKTFHSIRILNAQKE